MAVAAHQGIDIFRIRRPVGGEHLAPAALGTLVPEFDVAVGNGVDVGHFALSFDKSRLDRLIDYRRWRRPNRLLRRSWVSACFAEAKPRAAEKIKHRPAPTPTLPREEARERERTSVAANSLTGNSGKLLEE